MTRNYSYYTSSGTNPDNLGFVQSVVDVSYRTNSFGYTKGLVSSLTNELKLVTSQTWDALQRQTGTSYPDGTSRTGTYD